MKISERAKLAIRLIGLSIAAGATAGLVFASQARAQPATWNYTAPPGANSKATYPGDVVILGSCTGCGGGGGGVSLSVPQTWVATQTFMGSATTLGLAVPNIGEVATVNASAPTATTNYDVLTQSVVVYGIAAANNWTLNIRGNGSTSLNSIMSIGQSVTVAFLAFQGATPFYNTAVTIDGVSVTPFWQGGAAPTAGHASSYDVYTYTIIKQASASYAVLASQVQFK